MKMFIAIVLCIGLVPYLAKGSETKRFILTFSTCNDAIDNCAAYPPSVCSDPMYAGWAKDNCKKTCNLCSDGSSGSVPQPVSGSTSIYGSSGSVPQPVSGSTSTCSDKLADCSAYGSSSCTGQYVQWATDNCAKTCNLCSSRSVSSGGVPVPGSGSSGGVPVPGSGSSGGSFSGSSSGCFYNSQIYQEGTTWNDGCKYKCRCTDGTSGKYECRQLCLNWDLPPTCTMNPPAPGKCCPTPSCPSNIILQYPQGYVEE